MSQIFRYLYQLFFQMYSCCLAVVSLNFCLLLFLVGWQVQKDLQKGQELHILPHNRHMNQATFRDITLGQDNNDCVLLIRCPNSILFHPAHVPEKKLGKWLGGFSSFLLLFVIQSFSFKANMKLCYKKQMFQFILGTWAEQIRIALSCLVGGIRSTPIE